MEINSKNRSLVVNVTRKTFDSNIADQLKFIETKIDSDIEYFKIQKKIDGQDVGEILR